MVIIASYFKIFDQKQVQAKEKVQAKEILSQNSNPELLGTEMIMAVFFAKVYIVVSNTKIMVAGANTWTLMHN